MTSSYGSERFGIMVDASCIASSHEHVVWIDGSRHFQMLRRNLSMEEFIVGLDTISRQICTSRQIKLFQNRFPPSPGLRLPPGCVTDRGISD
jgi:hypothetical protein